MSNGSSNDSGRNTNVPGEPGVRIAQAQSVNPFDTLKNGPFGDLYGSGQSNPPVSTPTFEQPGNPFHMRSGTNPLPINPNAPVYGDEFLKRAIVKPVQDSFGMLVSVTGTPQQWKEAASQLRDALSGKPLTAEQLGRAHGSYITREKVDASQAAIIGTGKAVAHIFADFAKDPQSEWNKRADIIAKDDPALGRTLRKIGDGKPLNAKDYEILAGEVAGQFLPDMIVDGAVRAGGKRVPPRGHGVDVDTPNPGGKRPPSGDGQTIHYRPDPKNPGAYVPDFPETPRARLPAAEQANLIVRGLSVDGPLGGHVSREITQWSVRTGGKIEDLYASPGVLYGNTRQTSGLLGEALMDAAKIPADQRKAAHMVLAGVRDNLQDKSGRALADAYESRMPGKPNHAEFKKEVARYDKALDAAAAAELRQTPKGRQTLPAQEQAALLVKDYQVEGKLAPYLKREIVDWAQGRPKNAIENLGSSGTELFGDGTVTAQRKRMNGVAGEALADLVSTPANRKAVDSVISEIRGEVADAGLKGRTLMATFEDIATPGTQSRKNFDKRVSDRQAEFEQMRRETPAGRQTLPAKEQAALLVKEYGVEGKLAPFLQREIVDWAQGRKKNAIENLGSSGTELFGDGTVTAQRKRMNGVAGEALADAVSTPTNRKAVDSVINDIRYESAMAGEKGPALMARFEAIATPGSEARVAFDKRVSARQIELDAPPAPTPEMRQSLPVKQQAEQLLTDYGVKGRFADNLQVEIEIWAHGKPKNAVESLRSNGVEMFGDGNGKHPAGLMGQALIGAVAQPGNRDAVASVVRDLRLEAGQHNTTPNALAEQFGKIVTQGTPERQNFDARVATRQTELEAAARTSPPTTETSPQRPNPSQDTPPGREQRQLPPASDVADPLLPFHQLGRAKRADIPDPILRDGKAYEIGGITADGQLRLRPEGEVVRNIPSEAMFVNGARKPDGSFEQVGREVSYRGETWRFDALASPGWQPGVAERGFGLVDPNNPARKAFVPADQAGDITVRFASDNAYRLGDVRHGVIRLQPADPGAELLYRPKPGDRFEARLNGRELEGVKTIAVGQDGQLTATGTLRNGTEATQKVQIGDLAPRWRDVESPDFKDKFQVDSFVHREAAERGRALGTEPTGLPLRDPNFGSQPESVRPKLSLGAGSLDDQADFIRAQSAKIPPGGDARLTVYNIAFNNQGEAQRVLDAMGDFRERHPNAKIEVVAYKPSFDSFQGNQAEFAKLNQFIKDNGVDLKFMEGTTSRQVIHAKGVAVNDEVLFTTGAVIEGSKHKADISTPLSREGGAAFRQYFDEAVLGDASNVRRQALAADLAGHGVLINDPVARLPYIARAQDGLIRGADKDLFIGVSELRNPDTARDIVKQLGDKPGLKVEIQYREMDPQSQAVLQQAQKDFPGRLQVQDVSKWEPRPHFNTIIADGQQAYVGTAYLWPNQQQMVHHGRSFENGVLLQGESVRQLQGQLEGLRQLQPANPGQPRLSPAADDAPDVGVRLRNETTGSVSISAPPKSSIGVDVRDSTVNGSIQTVSGSGNVQVSGNRETLGTAATTAPDGNGNVQVANTPGLRIELQNPGASGRTGTDVRIDDSTVNGSVQSIVGNQNIQIEINEARINGDRRQTVIDGEYNRQTQSLGANVTAGSVTQTVEGRSHSRQQIGDDIPAPAADVTVTGSLSSVQGNRNSVVQGDGNRVQIGAGNNAVVNGVRVDTPRPETSNPPPVDGRLSGGVQNSTVNGSVSVVQGHQNTVVEGNGNTVRIGGKAGGEERRAIEDPDPDERAFVLTNSGAYLNGQSVAYTPRFSTQHGLTGESDGQYTTISGHGVIESDGVSHNIGNSVQRDTFVVPEGVNLHFLGLPGSVITDRLGQRADVGGDLTGVPLMKLGAGDTAPDILITPDFGTINIKGNPITVDNPQGVRLSQLIREHDLSGNIVVSSCLAQSVSHGDKDKWTGITFDLPDRYPKPDPPDLSDLPPRLPIDPNFHTQHGLTNSGDGKYTAIGGNAGLSNTNPNTGKLFAEQSFTVPEGVTVYFPSLPGGSVHNRLAEAIEKGEDLSRIPLLKAVSGSTAPDPLLLPGHYEVAGNFVRITDQEGQRLSEVIKEHGLTGNVVVAAGLNGRDRPHSNVLFDLPEHYPDRNVRGGTRSFDLTPERTIAPQPHSQSQPPARRSLEPDADNRDRIVAQTADQRNLLQRTWDNVLDTRLPAVANISVYAQQSGPDAKWQASLPVPAGDAIRKMQEYMQNNLSGDSQASVDDVMRPANAAVNKLQQYMINNARGESQASVDDFLRLVDPRRVADVKHSPAYMQQSALDANGQASLQAPAGDTNKLQTYMANNARGESQASVDDALRSAAAAVKKLQEYATNNARGDAQASVEDFMRSDDPRRGDDVKRSPASALAGGVDFVTGVQRVQSLKIEIDGANVEGGALRWDAKASAYQLNVTADAGGYVLNAPLTVTPSEAVTPLNVSGARLTGPAADAIDFPGVTVKMSDEYGAITLPAGTRLSGENVALMNGVLANPEYRSRAGETQYAASAKANYVVSEPRADADARGNVFNRVFAGEYGALEAPKQKLDVSLSPSLLGIHVSNPPMYGTRVGFEVERVQGPTIRELMDNLRDTVAPRDRTVPPNDDRQSALPPAPPQPGQPGYEAYAQSRGAVERLNAAMNIPYGEPSERLTVTAAAVAIDQRLRVDEVALNPPSAAMAGGTTAFVIERGTTRESDRYGSVPMQVAMQTPLEEGYRRLGEVAERNEQNRQRTPQTPAQDLPQRQEDQTRGPRMA